MREEVRHAVHNALRDTWEHSIRRQELLIQGYGDFLQEDNYIGAPLTLRDLYAGVKRKVSDAKTHEIIEVLDKDSRWQGEYFAPYGRGTFSYRLLSTFNECNFLLRFGEHPSNGLMYLWTPEDKPKSVSEIEDYLYGTPVEEVDFDELTGGIRREKFASAVEKALRSTLEDLEEEEAFGFQSVAGDVFEALEKAGRFDEEPDNFGSLVQSQITSWSQRLLQVNMHSETALTLVFDVIRLPSRRCYITEWNDNEDAYLVAKLKNDTPDGIYASLKTHLMSWFEPEGQDKEEDDEEAQFWAKLFKKSENPARSDFVINGRLIEGDKEYPYQEDSFWRDLLGFEAMSVSIPKTGLSGRLAEYVGRDPTPVRRWLESGGAKTPKIVRKLKHLFWRRR